MIVKPPAGAGADKVRVRFPVAVPVMGRFAGEKTTVALTCTTWLAGVYPGAVAVMFADPRPTPVTCACVVGVVAPAGTITLEVIVTREESAVSVTVTPPAGAGVDSVTGNGAVSPSPTFSPVGIVIVPGAHDGYAGGCFQNVRAARIVSPWNQELRL